MVARSEYADDVAVGRHRDGVVLRTALPGERGLPLAHGGEVDGLRLELEVAGRRLGRQGRGELGPPLQELVGHRPGPGPELVALVRERRLVRESRQHGVVDRQRELALHLGQRQGVVVRPGEPRSRRAVAQRAVVPPPPDEPGQHGATAPTRLVLQACQESRADPGPLAVGVDVDVELRELEVVEERRAQETGADGDAVVDGRPATDHAVDPPCCITARSSSSIHGVAASPSAAWARR